VWSAVGVTGPWAVVGALVMLVVTSLWRGWVMPARTADRLLAGQQQTTELYKLAAETERKRADAQQEDLVRLMRELTAALERSRPAGSP